MSPPILPSTLVDIVSLAVHHFAATFSFVVCKFAGVGVTGRVRHGAVTGSLIGGPVADVCVSVHVDDGAWAVDEPVRDIGGCVFGAEGTVDIVGNEVARIVVVAEVVEEVGGVMAFTLRDEILNSTTRLISRCTLSYFKGSLTLRALVCGGQ